MRSRPSVGIAALALCGCSPPAHIVTTVRSPSDVLFEVTTDKDDPGCIDHLAVWDAGGIMRWDISRKADAKTCVRELTFPQVPPGFIVRQGATVLAKGDYHVEAASGIYRGVDWFTIN